jgi:hypothetical protein
VVIRAQKWALNSPTSGGRSVGIVRLWAEATKFLSVYISSLNAAYYLVTLLPHICFGCIRPSSGVFYLDKIVRVNAKLPDLNKLTLIKTN